MENLYLHGHTILKHEIIRHVWVYFSGYDHAGRAELSAFQSPDRNAITLNFPTPFDYITSRGDVRYIICSQVALTREAAVSISKHLYEAEFNLAHQIKMKQRSVR